MLTRSLCIALAALLLCVVPAQAHDSMAPRDAKHAWLPADDDWVMQHWMPFDEARLYDALDIDNLGLERWLRNDHHTIAQLAARKGLTADALTDQLIEPRRGTVPDDQLAVLRERTMRTMTQGHLAQHVLFHYFHGSYALENTQKIFGVDRKTYKRLRLAGATPFQIGRRGGRTPAQVDRGMRGILRYGADLGVSNESQTPAQAAYMLRRRRALLPCFLRRPMPKLDRGNPYGDPNNGHGPHARGTRNGLLRGSKEATARRDPHSCWHEPALPPATGADAAATEPQTAEPTAAAAAQPGLEGGWSAAPAVAARSTEATPESALCHLAGI
jgi:hypothetical protein